jgi:hypothetical protein
MARNPEHVELSPNEARQARPEGVGRYVLGVSLALVVIAFAIIYFIFF